MHVWRKKRWMLHCLRVLTAKEQFIRPARLWKNWSRFCRYGISVAEGPDLEDDFHNFTALNFPLGHPAREMHDTFYLPNDERKEGEAQKEIAPYAYIDRSDCYMLENKPPIKIICMGRVYRSDYDITHTPVFHQMEGLVIDKATHMGHLKGCLMDFVRSYFEI